MTLLLPYPLTIDMIPIPRGLTLALPINVTYAGARRPVEGTLFSNINDTRTVKFERENR
jgi:hypothetical protein